MTGWHNCYLLSANPNGGMGVNIVYRHQTRGIQNVCELLLLALSWDLLKWQNWNWHIQFHLTAEEIEAALDTCVVCIRDGFIIFTLCVYLCGRVHVWCACLWLCVVCVTVCVWVSVQVRSLVLTVLPISFTIYLSQAPVLHDILPWPCPTHYDLLQCSIMFYHGIVLHTMVCSSAP